MWHCTQECNRQTVRLGMASIDLQQQCCFVVQVLLTAARLQPVEDMPQVVDLLTFILKKDPMQRPCAAEVQAR